MNRRRRIQVATSKAVREAILRATAAIAAASAFRNAGAR